MQAKLCTAFVATLVLITAGGGCGTRVKRVGIGNTGGVAETPISEASAGRPSDMTADPGAGPGTVVSSGAASPGSPVSTNRGAAVPASGPASGVAGHPSLPPRGNQPAVNPAAPESAKGNGASTENTTKGSAPTVQSPPQRRSPIVVASVGTVSGPAGRSLLGMVAGTQVWVKYINEKGGLNGHTVNLLVFDDGGDPARHRAQVQQAIEQDKAIAFLNNVEVLTGAGSIDYINSKGVPIIGMSGAEDWAYQSPMYFPQGATGPALYDTYPAAISQEQVSKGHKNVGILRCTEAAGCATIQRAFEAGASRFGYNLVYKGAASLAQPDYTAECLAARNAGVETIYLAFDANSIARIAASCARQAYRPVYAWQADASDARTASNPNLDGSIAISRVFPFFKADTPATAEFQSAMKRFGGSFEGLPGPASGWVAGKLLERAAAHLPEPPTTAAILSGLWGIHDDTLDGLSGGVSFNRGQPPTPMKCNFVLRLADGKWTSPDNGQPRCIT